jgi:hypothetical protein
MSSLKVVAAFVAVTLITACAAPGGSDATSPSPGNAAAHAAHHPNAATPPSMAAMQDQMKAMQEMRDKMMNAKTPEERQALMADHMKAMQGGMQMMKGMGGMGGMGAMGGAACMSDPKGMPVDPIKCQQTMEQRMDMMQMMMEMMMQRMPASGAPPMAK